LIGGGEDGESDGTCWEIHHRGTENAKGRGEGDSYRRIGVSACRRVGVWVGLNARRTVNGEPRTRVAGSLCVLCVSVVNFPEFAMQKFLLVNLNNTSTKLGLADEKELLAKKVILTRSLSLPAVRRAIRRWTFDRVLVGSVVPKKTAVFRNLFGNRLLEVTPDLDLGVGIDFSEPHGIGADRLSNAVGVTTRYGSPAIVVDFGTALTFDIISSQGVYQGGVIAPGLGAMTDYLYQRTALLPKIDLEEPVSVIGKTTKDAMLAGAIYGYRGLVRQIVTEIVAKLEGKVRIIATGSYANLIAAKLPELQIVDLDLTLEGLRVIALRNFPS
jgi:type III pantothenate kinase